MSCISDFIIISPFVTINGFLPAFFLIKLKDPIVPKGLFSFINLILYFGFNSSQ